MQDYNAGMPATLLQAVKAADEDFEWYPTTQRMIDVVADRLPHDFESIMDIGAGDGRVLVSLGKRSPRASLYAIEKATTLVQAWPESITPVGTDLFEQALFSLPADFIFCNPPYSEFEMWAATIIETGFAKRAYLVIPRRWQESKTIAASLAKRGATATAIHSDDFLDGERRARAIVDIVEIRYPSAARWDRGPQDPFDVWFDQNISTFDVAPDVAEPVAGTGIANTHALDSIASMVAAYDDEYAMMERNYRAIFDLDYALLKELGVTKDAVRDGIKKRMAGLKAKYWAMLFERMGSMTERLSTATRKRFTDKINGRTSVAFTNSNAYAVILWAIKHANRYYDEQLVDLFKSLSTFDGVLNYKSNLRTWEKSAWRFKDQNPTHYALDYRIVLERSNAIANGDCYRFEYAGNLYKACHEIIDDIVAVLGNLGFASKLISLSKDEPLPLDCHRPSRNREWHSGEWQDWRMADDSILFQVKAFKNGNLHLRFKPDAIRALNVEASRLLGWVRSPADVVAELGYTMEDATRHFRSSRQILPSSVRLLSA